MQPTSDRNDRNARIHAWVEASGCQRGSTLVLCSVALVALLMITGLAVDLGIAYVAAAGLTKAVDAGALAGALHTGKGETAMRAIIADVAKANLPFDGEDLSSSFEIEIDSPSTDTMRVAVSGHTEAPTFFSSFLGGTREIAVAKTAEAMRYPLDLSLVLDISGSLVSAHVFDDMQEASTRFVNAFDDRIDRVGIVSYMTVAREELALQKNFKSPGTEIISNLNGGGWTNMEDAMRIGKAQIDNAPERTSSMKIVVLFTDGKPTAFTETFWMDDPVNDCSALCDSHGDGESGGGNGCGTYPNVLASLDSDADGVPHCFTGAIAENRDLYHLPNAKQIGGWFSSGGLDYAPPWNTNPRPQQLPNGATITASNVRAMSVQQSEEWGHRIRNEGYTIYSIALGNSGSGGPDLALLRRIANEKGIVSNSQPRGEMMFAPSAAQLEDVFARLASRILTRLTR